MSCGRSRRSMRSRTCSYTSSTVIFCMHTLLLQGEKRWLNALTQGLQARSRRTIRVSGPNGAKSAGVSGPKSTTAVIFVIEAKWPGPLSLVTRTSASV